MRILLLNQFFWPDSAATSQLLTDLARALAANGYEVHAIAGDSGYASAEAGPRPDVHIHRAPAVPFARGRFARPASYVSFLLSAAGIGLTIPKPDIVVTLTTPPLLSLVGGLIKALRGSTHFIWEMDMYPDIAFDLKVMRPSGLLARLTRMLANRARLHADGVIALGECMRERLLSHGIPEHRVAVADNWADGRDIVPGSRAGGTAISRAPEPLTILYSGNLGLAHDTDTIYGAMLQLRDNPDFRFVFAGSGPRRTALEARCKEAELRHAEFRPYSSRLRLGESLCQGDIGLVTQIPDTLGSLVPSKIYGLMAAGRPVLFIGPKESTPARIIRRFHCGWQVECGDVPALTRLLMEAKASPELVLEAGKRARAAFELHFDLTHGVSRISSIIGAPLIPAARTSQFAAR